MLGDAVPVNASGLRGNPYGDQQLEVAARPERDRRIRVGSGEALDDRTDAFTLRRDAAARFVEVAAGQVLRDGSECVPGVRRAPQARSRADDVERRTTGADELVRSRSKLSVVDARDGGPQLRLELGQLSPLEDGRDDGIGSLEEVIDDF